MTLELNDLATSSCVLSQCSSLSLRLECIDDFRKELEEGVILESTNHSYEMFGDATVMNKRNQLFRSHKLKVRTLFHPALASQVQHN